MFEIAVSQTIRMLTHMRGFFDKAHAHAAAKKYDVGVLLQSRLAPDQYPLLRQVQVACDNAKGLAARLSGKTPPVHEDNETNLEQVRARIDKTITYLKTFKADDFKGWEERAVEVPWMPGKYLTGSDYFAQLGVPNFYFHLNCAYQILRHNGIDVGKTDYIGADLPFKDKK